MKSKIDRIIYSMAKKKGFTFIELIMVLSILAILFSYSLVSLSGYNQLQNKIDVDLFSNNIINFINRSKSYCRDNQSGGYIYFDIINKRISLNCDGHEVYNLNVPQGFTLNMVRSTNKIKIDNLGVSADACSIKFKDRKGEYHCLTMCVGTAYVEIKY